MLRGVKSDTSVCGLSPSRYLNGGVEAGVGRCSVAGGDSHSLNLWWFRVRMVGWSVGSLTPTVGFPCISWGAELSGRLDKSLWFAFLMGTFNGMPLVNLSLQTQVCMSSFSLFSINYLNITSEPYSTRKAGGSTWVTVSLTLAWPHARALGSETLLGHLEMPLSFQSAWSCQLCCLGTSKPHIGMGLRAGPEVLGLSILPAYCCMWLIPLRSCYIPEAGMGSCCDGTPPCLSCSPLRVVGLPPCLPCFPQEILFQLFSSMDYGNKSLARKQLVINSFTQSSWSLGRGA